jgi:thioredoxin 1
MALARDYEATEPARAEVDRFPGATLLEFGNAWCGHCMRAQPLVADALEEHPAVHHLKIADASGKRLGRSYQVKLWPTLVFLRDGVEVARAVRPHDVHEIRAALEKIDPRQPGATPTR